MIQSFIDPTVTVSSPLTRTGLGPLGIQDATTTDKGAASFSSTNFTVTAGAVDTIQGISTTASPQFTALGVGVAPDSTKLIYASKTYTATNTFTGIFGGIVQGYNAADTIGAYGLNFFAQYTPAGAAAAWRCQTLTAVQGTVTITDTGTDTQNVAVTLGQCFSASMAVNKLGAGTVAISTTGKTVGWGRMFASNAATVSGGTILNLASFGEVAAQTVATNNWGCYLLTANNFMTALQLGGTPTVGMGTGTLSVSGLSTLTGGISLPASANIALATTTGTKIGTATTQLLGFYNATPVDQPATVTDPTGGLVTDAEARTAIITVIDRLQELGLVA